MARLLPYKQNQLCGARAIAMRFELSARVAFPSSSNRSEEATSAGKPALGELQSTQLPWIETNNREDQLLASELLEARRSRLIHSRLLKGTIAVSKPNGGKSTDCPESSLQYCPLSQLEKLETAAELIAQGGVDSSSIAAHLRNVIHEMRNSGVNCASGHCRVLANAPR